MPSAPQADHKASPSEGNYNCARMHAPRLYHACAHAILKSTCRMSCAHACAHVILKSTSSRHRAATAARQNAGTNVHAHVHVQPACLCTVAQCVPTREEAAITRLAHPTWPGARARHAHRSPKPRSPKLRIEGAAGIAAPTRKGAAGHAAEEALAASSVILPELKALEF